MARVNVTIHGEEDVSTAAQKVRTSLHDLKDKAKEATAPFKDFTDTIKTVAGLGGAAVVLRQIWNEMAQMESGFAKLHPELATMNGSLQQWQATTGTLNAALGGLITAGIAPLRGALISLLEPWAKNIQASADFAIMLSRLNQMGKEGEDLASRLAAAETRKTELLAAQARARMTEGSTDLTQIAYFARGATSSSFLTDYTKSIADLDKEIADLTAQLKSDKDKATALLKGPEKPAAGTPMPPAGVLYGPAADYLPPAISSALRGQMDAEERTRDMIEVLVDSIGAFWEDPATVAMQAASDAFAAQADMIMGAWSNYSMDWGAQGPWGDVPTFADRAGAGLGELWSGGTTGQMFGAGGDPLGALADSISPLLASFASLQALLDPVSVILGAMFDVLQPVIDSLLAPLVGILTIFGQTLGAMITPLLKILAPVIDWIGRAFVWLYNNAIVPVGNAFIQIFTALSALATLIFYIVTFQWGKIGGISWSADAGSLLKPITTGDLTAAGMATTGTGGYGGSSTNVVKPPDIYVTITVEGSVYGSGGPVEVGREMVHAIEEYIGTGARVSFLEAGA